MVNRVYPVGYSHHNSRQRVQELMQSPQMLLVECRKTPYSKHLPEWRAESLQRQYGKRYRARAGQYLGNPHHAENQRMKNLAGWNAIYTPKIGVIDADNGIATLIAFLRKGYDLILLCACSSFDACHLKEVVRLLQARMPEVEVIRHGRLAVQSDTIKALSISQPFASWIVHPEWFQKYNIPPKTIENRGWQTEERGNILIHAAKSWEPRAVDYFAGMFGSDFYKAVPENRKDYPAGALIGIANLYDIVTDSDDPWYMGEYGWCLSDIRPIEPIQYKGQRGLFDVPYSVLHGLPQEPKVNLLLQDGALDREEAYEAL